MRLIELLIDFIGFRYFNFSSFDKVDMIGIILFTVYYLFKLIGLNLNAVEQLKKSKFTQISKERKIL